MESKLENILDNMMQNDHVVGALLSDNQGLCYGSKFGLFTFCQLFVYKVLV